MKLEGTEDLRVQKTVGAIRDTFKQMICEMDYAKITVKELCDRARINKKTFYRYYPTLDDLLCEFQMEMSEDYIEDVKDLRLPEQLDIMVREFFLFSVNHGEVYEKVTCSGSYHGIRQKMIDNIQDNTWRKSETFSELAPCEQNLFLAYLTVTATEIYGQWMADGKKVPLERVIMLAQELICNGVNGFMKTERP